MNATITFATQTRSTKAAQHKEPRSARRSIFSIVKNAFIIWLLNYPVRIV